MSTFSGYATAANALTTELNALPNGSRAVQSANADNTTALAFWADAELNVTFGSAPTAGNTVDLYLIPGIDGTNYADNGAGTLSSNQASGAPSGTYLVGSFELQAVTTAQRVAVPRIPLLPGKWKWAAYNNSGQAFPASGSTITYRTYATA
jgi:hypothetical protein